MNFTRYFLLGLLLTFTNNSFCSDPKKENDRIRNNYYAKLNKLSAAAALKNVDLNTSSDTPAASSTQSSFGRISCQPLPSEPTTPYCPSSVSQDSLLSDGNYEFSSSLLSAYSSCFSFGTDFSELSISGSEADELHSFHLASPLNNSPTTACAPASGFDSDGCPVRRFLSDCFTQAPETLEQPTTLLSLLKDHSALHAQKSTDLK